MEFHQATLEERKLYYSEEWDKREIPDFILHTLSLREFGFDLEGSGPSNRYNRFTTVEQLGDFLRNKAPYAAYCSVALYEQPWARKGWLKSELVFDLDAKDLPFKSCCPQGEVCERCLEDAKQVAIQLAETLRSDLDLKQIHFVFSGRGFHLRVTDEAVMGLEQAERGQIVEYVTGSLVPTDLTLALGYSRVFRERVARTLERLRGEDLARAGLRRGLAKLLIKQKQKVIAAIRAGRIKEIEGLEGLSTKTLQKLLESLARFNSEVTDGKVTIDTKRILRLPSSLHSAVSMKCMVVRDIEGFSPDQAVPKFLRERIK